MEKTTECKRCGKSISNNILSQQNKPDSTEWVKNGFCSQTCFVGIKENPIIAEVITKPDVTEAYENISNEDIVRSIAQDGYSRDIKKKNPFFFFSPNIPKMKLEKALIYYDLRIEETDVIMLFDGTVFGSLKNGVLMTDKALYARENKKINQIDLTDINNVSIEPGVQNLRVLIINDKLFYTLTKQQEAVFHLFKDMLFGISQVFPERTIKNEINSKGMSQISEAKPDEKLSICTFCGKENELENRIVACVSNTTVNVCEDSEKQTSTSESQNVDFDLIEWNILLCHSCIVHNRKKVSYRHMGEVIGGFILSFIMFEFGISLLSTADVGYQFQSFWIKFLIFVKVCCIIGIIVSPIILIAMIISHRSFIRNKSEIKEDDKIMAFEEAGKRILDDLKKFKAGSKFKHFSLPKMPKEEDIVKMFPNKHIEHSTPEMFIRLANDK